MKREVRPIDANDLDLKIREYMSSFPNSPTRLAACRDVLSMLGDEGQTPTIADHFLDATKMGPLTLEQLRQMDGQPVWIVEYPDWGHWELSEDAEDYIADRDPDFYGLSYPDPEGKGGLHKIGWFAYAYLPAHIDLEARIHELETAYRLEKCEDGPECAELGKARMAMAAAEARAEKAERERDAAVRDLRQMCIGGNTCAFCKFGRNCGKQGPGRKTVEPCWEWCGQKEK